ncbi:FAD/NAD(P)-binding domain-containing protein [Polychaeton citri CBS 116435]|uniref:FAD/NAD(P)-binding domain-containing protein n=1 Tax=Polychaeton citri CBS 116435 TaxID=1314669 RepID=A0A9P4UQQ9_9PEZI|nr:FAD/NAD(P)-binding domain-containing protein [Polychaeton citri CBS 116435]
MEGRKLHVGIVGAGIGGLMAAIAIARSDCDVTVLEAAEQLGEIGAGIQMTSNVARFLQKYGVDKAIGNDLVQFDELNLRRQDGTKVGHTQIKSVEDALGYPWWLVHRHHLHSGLVQVARQEGVRILINSRVASLDHQTKGLAWATTVQGETYKFDLIVGSDGVSSVVRRLLFPGVRPEPPSGNCAYRAIVPLEKVRQDPITKSLVEDSNGCLRRTMEVWMSPLGYIITYPISNSRDFNMVLSHYQEERVTSVQEVEVAEVREQYRDYDPKIRRVIDMIGPPICRWPLLVTGPLESWSSPDKKVVLIGDAAHSMVNHMAQGAATAMEDGVFLARCLRSVAEGDMSLADAICVYEKGRMPKARYKQQLSFLNGAIWQLPDGAAQQARNEAMQETASGGRRIRSSNLYGDPTVVLECYGYDAEDHADTEIAAFLSGREVLVDQSTAVTQAQADRTMNWFLPKDERFKIKPRL